MASFSGFFLTMIAFFGIVWIIASTSLPNRDILLVQKAICLGHPRHRTLIRVLPALSVFTPNIFTTSLNSGCVLWALALVTLTAGAILTLTSWSFLWLGPLSRASFVCCSWPWQLVPGWESFVGNEDLSSDAGSFTSSSYSSSWFHSWSTSSELGTHSPGSCWAISGSSLISGAFRPKLVSFSRFTATNLGNSTKSDILANLHNRESITSTTRNGPR